MPQPSLNEQAKVAVVTDSVAQVPVDLARQLGITVIPFTVQMDGRTYLDGIDIEPGELYHRMRQDHVSPTTAAPSLGEYQRAFSSCLHGGTQSAFCISLSSKLSSGYTTACYAANATQQEFSDRVIQVFDSRQATISQGFVAIAAARAAMQGKSLEEVRQAAEDAKQRVGFAAALETLEYLARGGRIGKAAFMAGSLLKIKPILSIDDEGVVAPLNRVRGECHALQCIVEYVAHKTADCSTLRLAIMEADNPDHAAQLEELALQTLRPVEILHSEFTPVMGVHAGPGVVGLGYYYE
ncbi:MAG TPA: DegV family protein [Anaerolineales bacterium]|nr:DegV family protein [Anaerolineales bacterium]